LAENNGNESFFQELKRRNVYRVGVGYAIVSWLLLQVIDVVLPIMGLPDWVPGLVLTMLAVGFPIALIFAWAYEMTPEGLKREKEVDRSQSITDQTGRKLDRIIIGVLVVAVGMLLVDKFLLTGMTEAPGPAEPVASEASEAAAPVDAVPSIAVLPFVNMSADESSTYFSDGLADTLLHMLAQIRELRVAARTSSFQFRDKAMDIGEIGRSLKVATVLEGSVQRSGEQIRVTAQLIDVDNGYHLWSGNFDRDLDDVFEIQDEIAHEVVSALKVSLLGEPAETLDQEQTESVAAYTEYLLAIDELNAISFESLSSAVGHLQEAIRLDPDYARAYSTLGRAYMAMRDYGAMRQSQALAAARGAAARALDLAPASSEALAVLGAVELYNSNFAEAEKLLGKAVEIGPNDTTALDYYAQYLSSDARPREAIEVQRKLLRIDPLSEVPYFTLAVWTAGQGDYDAAMESIAAFKSVRPEASNAYAAEGFVEASYGNYAAALKAMVAGSELDTDDPEGFYLPGKLSLNMGLPERAAPYFDRAVEIDAGHPVSRAAPLVMALYENAIDEDDLRLARELLADGISARRGARYYALFILIEDAAASGRHAVALEALDNLYPGLLDDPPEGLDKDLLATFMTGWALLQSGDTKRGTQLIESHIELMRRYEEAYSVGWPSVAAPLLLGDRDAALVKLRAFAPDKYRSNDAHIIMEHSALFEPIRDEPEFIAVLEDYRRNAAEQRALLETMNLAPVAASPTL
jgi:TolB-like protein